MAAIHTDVLIRLGESLLMLAEMQAKWSRETFGDDRQRGPRGPLKHLVKEAGEALANPTDPKERADCLILILDAERRAGGSVTKLLTAALLKMDENLSREWPKYIPFVVSEPHIVDPDTIPGLLCNGVGELWHCAAERPNATGGKDVVFEYSDTAEKSREGVYQAIRRVNDEPVEHVRNPPAGLSPISTIPPMPPGVSYPAENSGQNIPLEVLARLRKPTAEDTHER